MKPKQDIPYAGSKNPVHAKLCASIVSPVWTRSKTNRVKSIRVVSKTKVTEPDRVGQRMNIREAEYVKPRAKMDESLVQHTAETNPAFSGENMKLGVVIHMIGQEACQAYW